MRRSGAPARSVMNIGAVIEYWGPGVATFDPQKVLGRLKEQFPEAATDTTDRAEHEVASLDLFLEHRSGRNTFQKRTLKRRYNPCRWEIPTRSGKTVYPGPK